MKEFAPQYYIRIFPRVREQFSDSFVISPKNVVAISVSRNTSGSPSSWSIQCDFRYTPDEDNIDGAKQNSYLGLTPVNFQSTLDQKSWFFHIEPMDYVEIFMRRESPKIKNKPVAHDFGVYLPTNGDTSDYIFKSFSNTLDKQGIERPLSIIEKINNPDLVMCGFVDSVNLDFNVLEGSTSNRFTIKGKGVEKFLHVHEVFWNVQRLSALYIQKKFQESIPRLTTPESVVFLLTEVLDNWVNDIMEVDVSNAKKLKALDEKMKGVMSDNGFTDKNADAILKEISNGEPTSVQTVTCKQTDDPEGTPLIKVDYTDPTFYNYVVKKLVTNCPSSRQIYYSIWDKLGTVVVPSGVLTTMWGRIEYLNTGMTRSILNLAEGKVWDILQQTTNMSLNELWVDETGNVVYRTMDDAWRQLEQKIGDVPEKERSAFIFDSEEWNTTSKRVFSVDGDEILSWNVSKSDEQLKTVILTIPTASLMGRYASVAGTYGQAPILNSDLSFLLNLLSSEEKRVNPEDTGTLDALQQQILYYKKKQGNRVLSYDLQTDAQVKEFWSKFGLRSMSVHDLWSDTIPQLVRNSFVAFSRFANMVFSGRIVVRGDSRFKVGRAIFIKPLNIMAYIVGISHEFSWGDNWKTTIEFNRGMIPGTLTSTEDLKIEEADVTRNPYDVPTYEQSIGTGRKNEIAKTPSDKKS